MSTKLSPLASNSSLASFYLGCAVWAYKGWVGEFYPKGSRAGDFLQLYSQRLTAVEGNTTFYATPNAETIARWAEQTPPGFKFCLKFPKALTHNGLLKPAIPGAIAFLELARGLGDRTGPVFVQLPPSYTPAHLDDLSKFFTTLLSCGIPLALEVRHPDWFTEPHASELNSRLHQLGVGRVLLDSRPIYNCPDDPQRTWERKKPQLPLQPVVTAPFSLIRFVSHPEQSFNPPYLDEWVETVANWIQQGTETYFFVHCPIEARSPLVARHFQQLLEKRGVSVPPLPWEQFDAGFNQLSLF
ncbi:DUF72 domain-containing protein [Desertifilum sp. FACHB-1129]|uniref:DUF72 domain-containing protein n=1 Tax=Desertifilum tharense IPPAS B-1220 TaxID=1781255 RepID=A0A1E5QHG4_9CYAN|nr:MULTISPECIES: DUF72 domain-containing protein [Desertifilum]MDA0210905.1 DUF72 domain-containing protein [Cyanobacteria bacterium FC1]MBD2313490.1 DUF72 domain-containing protein [Desertifilum sp. FACHB-1129]MBD2322361.1 DUF72 domain-containing protein [Desertifilum sp. FACHB-866]MBD2332523.1 DUF72 domain-containing protein [Desertifilum sp. FACHB-868]OEJ74044.1 hypothetical protein BH720_16590 [Desertifilum tharense IPPAS B-1220]